MQQVYRYGSVVHVPCSSCSASAMSIKRARQRKPSLIEAFIVDECNDEDEDCVDEDEGSTATEAKVDGSVDEGEGVHEDERVDEDEGWGTELQGGHTDLLGGQLEAEGRTT